MNRTALLTITLLSSLATPFVVQATTPLTREAQPVPATATTPAPVANTELSCARKVKVIYAGYGEGAAGACPAGSEAAK
jgi:hypothetical protein